MDKLAAGPLKTELAACAAKKRVYEASDFSIGHRGAPLQFPEHTVESYVAAARMGAGIIECDVAMTADGELVCRHAHCVLHTTTNIPEVPAGAAVQVTQGNDGRRQPGCPHAGGLPVRNGELAYLSLYDDRQVGILGLFSDWPATTTFYANCKPLRTPMRSIPTH